MLHPHIHIDSRKVPIYGEIKGFFFFACLDQVYGPHSLFFFFEVPLFRSWIGGSCNYNIAPFGGSGSSAIKATKYVEGMSPNSPTHKAQFVLYALRLIFYELPMKYLELNPKGDESIDLLNYFHLSIL